MALPYGQQAVSAAYHALNPVPVHRVFLRLQLGMKSLCFAVRQSARTKNSNEKTAVQNSAHHSGTKSSV